MKKSLLVLSVILFCSGGLRAMECDGNSSMNDSSPMNPLNELKTISQQELVSLFFSCVDCNGNIESLNDQTKNRIEKIILLFENVYKNYLETGNISCNLEGDKYLKKLIKLFEKEGEKADKEKLLKNQRLLNYIKTQFIGRFCIPKHLSSSLGCHKFTVIRTLILFYQLLKEKKTDDFFPYYTINIKILVDSILHNVFSHQPKDMQNETSIKLKTMAFCKLKKIFYNRETYNNLKDTSQWDKSGSLHYVVNIVGMLFDDHDFLQCLKKYFEIFNINHLITEQKKSDLQKSIISSMTNVFFEKTELESLKKLAEYHMQESHINEQNTTTGECNIV